MSDERSTEAKSRVGGVWEKRVTATIRLRGAVDCRQMLYPTRNFHDV